MKEFRLLVLASGRGSHAVNLIEATRDGRIEGRVARVVSDRADAAVLTEARGLGVPTLTLTPVVGGSRLHPDAERTLKRVAGEEAVDLIALCAEVAAKLPDLFAARPNIHGWSDHAAVCTKNSDSNVEVMKSTEESM